MWGAQGWNQWALQPAMFNDVPHEQIDWAALAKQWIQMQQTQPPDSSAGPVIPPVPPPSLSPPSGPPTSIMHPPPPGHSLGPEEFPSEAAVSAPHMKMPAVPEVFPADRQFETEPAGFMPKGPSNAYWNKTQWEPSVGNEIDDRAWPLPPPIDTPTPLIGGKETYDYGHMHDNPPLAMQSIDYNHMSEFSYNQVYPPESQYDHYWSQVNAAPPIAPMFLKKEHSSSSATIAPSASLPAEEESSQIDAAKRKQLPAWIREGLEKMEQERLKKIEKEKAEKEKAEKLAQAALKKDLELKEVSNPALVKSKFESDSDDDDEVEEERPVLKKHDMISQRSPSPVEEIKTEEEKRQEYMLAIRRILTEVLLTVTNAEMYAIAEEVLRKERLKARQLASTASLTSVASGLRGLANYGTESEASEAEEEKEDSDSDEELLRRIKEKKRQFAIKEKKILAELERRELEEQNEALKAKNDAPKMAGSESPEPTNNIKNATRPNSMDEMNTVSFVPPTDVPEPTFSEMPSVSESLDNVPVEETNTDTPSPGTQKSNNKDLPPSRSESASSGSESETGEKDKKKSSKNKHEHNDSERSRELKKDKSPSRKHHRHSSESDSSGRHRKSRSYDKSSKKSSSYKKKKKYKRSDSSSSSSSSTKRKKYSSSKSESRHSRERRSHSYDDRSRKHRRSSSPKSYRSSRDSHRSSRDSYSYRYEKERHSRREKDEKYYDYKRSPSPYRRSSKLPKKYRSSRSLSSESESASRKLKKSRHR